MSDAIGLLSYYRNIKEKKSKCMAIVEFEDHHYERVDWIYFNKTGEIRFAVNNEEYLYLPGYKDKEILIATSEFKNYLQFMNRSFLKYDASRNNFYITDKIIRLLTSETDKGIKELEYILQTTEEKQKKEENKMKDILELVGKIEEILKKSKFEWFMTYDPKEKAWTFQVKEK